MSLATLFVHPAGEASKANPSVEEESDDPTAKRDEKLKRSQLPVERYDHRKGLKSLQVHQTLTSLDGRIWSATPAGLACYDGVNIYMFDRKHGLSSHGLRTLALHPDNTLWLGTDIGVEVLDISGLAPVVLWSQDIGTVNCLAVTQRRAVIGTSQGLFLWHGEGELTCSSEAEFAQATIKSILINDDGKTWAIGPRIGLVILGETGNIEPILGIAELIGKPTILTMGQDGYIWIGGAIGVACLDRNGSFIANYKTGSRVSALLYYDGYVWAGTGTDLLRLHFANKQLTFLDAINENISVLDMMYDSFDNIWISTGDQALLRISTMRDTFEENFDTDIGSIMCIRQNEQGLLVGGASGLVQGDDPVTLHGLTVWDILEDEYGKKWLATDEGLYCRVNPYFTIPYHHTECDVIAAPCRALAVHNNQLYVSSIRGLAVIESDGVHEVLGPDGKGLGYVYSLHVGPQGRLWIATLGRGIFRLGETGIAEVPIKTLSAHSNVYAFAHDSDGYVYAAHGNLISKINVNDQASIVVDADVAIAAWSLKCLDDNRLVAGTSNGLLVYDTESGATKHKISGNFDDVPWEFTTSRSLEVLDGSTIYCGLGSGLRKVSLDKLTKMNRLPSASFSYAKWRGIEPEENENEILVEEGRWGLEIGIKTGWYLDDCTMRSRLTGFDEAWSPQTQLGPVHYTSLPVGTYHLEVEICSPMAGIGPVSSIYKLRVKKT